MEMKPGRELNRLVAEKLFGWTKEECARNVMNYSTNIDTAWMVADKLRTMGPFFIEWWPSQNLWNCNDRLADTAPHAICLAALRACGADHVS